MPIRDPFVEQSYQSLDTINLGVEIVDTGDGPFRVYDLERRLIEFSRLRPKYPSDLYYEVLASLRSRKKRHRLGQGLRLCWRLLEGEAPSSENQGGYGATISDIVHKHMLCGGMSAKLHHSGRNAVCDGTGTLPALWEAHDGLPCRCGGKKVTV